MSAAPPFAHLHVHSEFSILDGACQISPLVERTADLGMEHIGLTDHGTMAGTVELFQKAKKSGINPVLGLEAYVTEDHTIRETREGKRPEVTHLTLLAENEEGFRNLMKLSSKGCLDGYYYRPRIDYGLMAEHSKGIIVLSGCMASKTQRLLADGNLQGGRDEIGRLTDIFGRDNFYMEFQDAGISEQKQLNEMLRGIQRDDNYTPVITADVHYLRHEDAKPHDALLCIQTKSRLSDAERFRFSTDQFWLKSPEEMYREFTALGYPEEWLARSVEIADRCRVNLSLGETLLPDFPWTDGLDIDEYLKKLCEEGLRNRYGSVTGDLQGRLNFELSTISKMGYSAYFLITWDWIAWAKSQGIAIGPGRGSAAGSLVAYTLGITDVDPIKYDLLFERFLNPDRISMPDIDTDVSVVGREHCINYLAERYGRDRVAQIATFGRMAPKAAVKDAARVMDYPVAIGDKVSKLIPDGPGQSFEENMKPGADLRKAYDSDETVQKIVDMARPLEGVVRNAGIHAAAVVIGAQPLSEIVPLRAGDHGDEVVTQVAQGDAEALGLLKMDVLGLRNLDVLEKVVVFIEQSRGENIVIADIPLDDAKTFEMIARGDNVGVFQLESDGMSGAARQIGPTRFEDLVAIVALYRPGPMAHIPKFAENKKNPGNIVYPDPRLEEILAPSYGITIYQEQYMLIARKLANFTPGEADELRKGIAKKIRAVLDQVKPRFLDGCAANDVHPKVAAALWDDAERAGDYSFNKSHSVCYALIAYQTAFLKCNYPAEYMAALISTVMHTKDKVPFYVNGCRKMGLEVLPPDVNESFSDFKVVGEKLRFGLTAVKGVGSGAVDSIVAAREERPFDSIWDFCERVDKNHANKRVVEALIKAGAFDSTGDSRKGMLDTLPQALALGAKTQADAAAGQFDLFGEAMIGADETAMQRDYPTIPTEEFTKEERLDLEKDATGLYMSGHPLDEYAEALEEKTELTIASVAGLHDKTPVVIGGMVNGLRQLVTRKGDPMAFAQVEDKETSIRLVVLPNVYEKVREKLQRDRAVVIVRGKVDAREGRCDIVADDILDIAAAPKLNTVTVVAPVEALNPETVEELARIIRNYPGSSNLDFNVRFRGTTTKRFRVGEGWKVSSEVGLRDELRDLLGESAVV